MIAYFKEEIPIFRYLWFFIGGIILSIYFNVASMPWIKYLWLSIFILLIFNLILSRVYNFFTTYIPAIGICILLFLSGLIITSQRNQITNPHHFSAHKAQQLIVTIYDTPK